MKHVIQLAWPRIFNSAYIIIITLGFVLKMGDEAREIMRIVLEQIPHKLRVHRGDRIGNGSSL